MAYRREHIPNRLKTASSISALNKNPRELDHVEMYL